MDDATIQKKKMILTSIVVTVIVFIVVLVILLILMGQEAQKTKLKIGDNIYKTSTIEITADDGVYQEKTIDFNGEKEPAILMTPQGENYYSIELMSQLTGYKYNNGAYGEQVNETKDKCYIDNGGEYVTFSANSNEITKAIKKNINTDTQIEGTKEIPEEDTDTSSSSSDDNSDKDELEEESFTLTNPIIRFNEKLYASEEAINKGFNLRIIPNGNILQLYTLEALTEAYSSDLSQKGYTLTTNFRNKRALSAGYAVVGKDKEYGVIDLSTNKEVLSLKYDTVEYVQSIGEFIVSSKSKFGMIKPGSETPTIKLDYESIKLLNAEKKLYIVGKNEKYGVVNASGEEIIPTEYDQIGLSSVSAYKSQGIKNKYIIADECIPVMRNKNYGLYGTNGQLLTSTRFSSIGCENPSEIIENTSAMPTLTIPLSDKVTGIVFSMKNGAENTVYGIITTKGTVVLNAYYTAIYYMQRNGNITYYFNKPANNELLTLQELLKTRATVKELIEQTKTDKELEEEQRKEKEYIDQANGESNSSDNNSDGENSNDNNRDNNNDNNNGNNDNNDNNNNNNNSDEENQDRNQENN